MPNPNLKAGPGRPKGSTNRINKNLNEVLDALGCNPAEGLARLAMDENVPYKVRESAYSTLFKSVYPQQRLVEMTGENKGPLTMKIEWAKDDKDAVDPTD